MQGGLRLPVRSNMLVDGLIVEKCRHLDSAQKPLWLVYAPGLTTDPTLAS